MLTSATKNLKERAAATSVRFDGNNLYVSLNDGREVCLPMDKIDWLSWLVNATPEQRADWSIEPGGFAVYWGALDDGVEVSHILTLEPLV